MDRPTATCCAGFTRARLLKSSVAADLLGAVLVLVLWFVLVRDALVDLSPAAIRERLPARARPTSRQWALSPVAAALGAATHVFWDAFTHAGRWGVMHVPWLREQHHGVAGYAWAQVGSGVVGLAVVGWAVVRHLRTLPPNAPRQRAVHPSLLPAVILAAGVCGLATAMRREPEGLHAMALSGVINGVVTLVVGTAVVCAAWHLRSRAEVT